MPNSYLKPLIAAAIGLCMAVAAAAQTITGSIRGTVADQTGAAIPSATVIVTKVDTGVKTQAVTNGDGTYSLRFLQIGRYKAKITAKGFQTTSYGPFDLEIDQEAKADFKLNVGEASTTVDVSADEAPILNTENATQSLTVTGNTIQSIALNGRNFSSVTLFVPGVVSTNPQGLTDSNAIERANGNDGQGASSDTPSVNGNRGQTNNYTLDGVEINEPINNLIGYNPSPDALSEIKVISANANAEYGNVNGGDILAVTKSGTNAFHGSAFGFLENYLLDANTFANKYNPPGQIVPRTHYTQTIFGGTIGGPVVIPHFYNGHDKVFFFADYEGARKPNAGIQQYAVATQAMRNGDFSELLTPNPNTYPQGVQLFNTLAAGYPAYQNNQITISNPAAVYLFAHPELYPLPNATPADGLIQNNYHAPQKAFTRNDQGDLKIDWRIGQSNTFFARYSQGEASDGISQPGLPILFPGSNSYPFKGVALNWVKVITPSLTNELRAGFSRTAWFQSVPSDTTGVFGLKGNSLLGILGTQSLPGFSSLAFNACPNGGTCYNNPQNLGNGGGGSTLIDNIFEYSENLSWQKGHHLIKFGAQFVRYQENNYYPGNYGALGQIQYYNLFSGNPNGDPAHGGITAGYTLADFELNRAGVAGQGGLSGPFGQRQWRTGYFAQDDWKILPNLTLNLGLRYEYDQPIYEVNNKELNVNLQTGATELAGQNGNSRALYNATYNNFMPRFGFAYQPTRRTVIRGGYGITTYLEGTGAGLRLTQNFPFLYSYQLQAVLPTTTTAGTPIATATAFANATSTGTIQNNNANTYYAYGNFKPSLIQEFSLTAEYQVTSSASFSVAYVGETGQHLIDARDGNQWTVSGDPTSAPYYNTLFNGTQGNLKVTESNAMSNYNALQSTYRQHARNGLEFIANYTYAKALTNNPGFFGVPGINGPSPYWQNAYDPSADYGPSGYDVRHNASGTLVYELPFGSGKMFAKDSGHLMDEIIGGWKLGTSAYAYSGFPVTISAPDVANVNNFASRASQFRPLIVKNRSVAHWFGTDPSALPCSSGDDGTCAYGTPAAGQFGTAAVGSQRAPGYKQVDFSLFKDFTVYHENKFGFRVDAFNALNISSYGNPDNYVGDGGNFGKINSVRSPNRQLQLSAHYNF